MTLKLNDPSGMIQADDESGNESINRKSLNTTETDHDTQKQFWNTNHQNGSCKKQNFNKDSEAFNSKSQENV